MLYAPLLKHWLFSLRERLLQPRRLAKFGIEEGTILDNWGVLSLHRGMSGPPHQKANKNPQRVAREERLAKALRDNLLRRKEQGRARDPRAAAQSERSDREREPPA